MNRGRLRGWALIGAVILVALAILSWPALVRVPRSAGIAVGPVLLTIWVHLSLPDAETEGDSDAEMAETSNLTTRNRDH